MFAIIRPVSCKIVIPLHGNMRCSIRQLIIINHHNPIGCVNPNFSLIHFSNRLSNSVTFVPAGWSLSELMLGKRWGSPLAGHLPSMQLTERDRESFMFSTKNHQLSANQCTIATKPLSCHNNIVVSEMNRLLLSYL